MKQQWAMVWRVATHAVSGAVLCLAACSAQAAGADIEGRVTHVSDGDSLWLETQPAGKAVELRLLGIDAPEICQAWGPQAQQALAELVLNKQVRVHTEGLDSYGRTLGTVYLDQRNINKLMVQEGHAWSTRYKYDRGPYVVDERMARALSRGLNRDGDAVMPRDFRRAHGPCEHAQPARAGAPPPPARPVAAEGAVAATPPAYRCDGRTRCSQMTSCAEATYFLNHCPGVKMDGNNDGVPCEKQWCRPGG